MGWKSCDTGFIPAVSTSDIYISGIPELNSSVVHILARGFHLSTKVMVSLDAWIRGRLYSRHIGMTVYCV